MSDKANDYDLWADWYDTTEGDREPYKKFYSGLVDTATESLLDLGCGTGVITTAVAGRMDRNGLPARVVGVDVSEQMLRVARSRDPEIDWRCADIRNPGLDGQFHLIISCFNTLQLLASEAHVAQTLASVGSMLARQGRFAFDIYQPNWEYLARAETDRLAREVKTQDGRKYEIREDRRYEPETHILHLGWRLYRMGGGNRSLITEMHYRLRQYSREEIIRLIGNAGLRVLEAFGNFDGAALDETSVKQIYVCGLP